MEFAFKFKKKSLMGEVLQAYRPYSSEAVPWYWMICALSPNDIAPHPKRTEISRVDLQGLFR